MNNKKMSLISLFTSFVSSIFKKSIPLLSLIGIALSLLVHSPKVQAEEYEEVSYDDLVNQISHRKSQINSRQETSANFDNLLIHAGIGLVTTATSINYQGNDNLKYQNGFELSMGIDLFSENWATEGVIRNFGQSTSGSETRSLRELDLKILYRSSPLNKFGFRAGAGLGTRYFKLSDSANGASIDDTTPTALAFGGLDVYLSKNVSLGIEAGLRSAMVSSTTDKNSIDTALHLDTYF